MIQFKHFPALRTCVFDNVKLLDFPASKLFSSCSSEINGKYLDVISIMDHKCTYNWWVSNSIRAHPGGIDETSFPCTPWSCHSWNDLWIFFKHFFQQKQGICVWREREREIVPSLSMSWKLHFHLQYKRENKLKEKPQLMALSVNSIKNTLLHKSTTVKPKSS